VAHNWALERAFEPSMPSEQRERLYRGWTKAASRALNWVEP